MNQANIVKQLKGYRWRRSVFRTLLVSMLAFGIAIGLVFPFFTKYAIGYDYALSVTFAVMCVIAGLAVGAFNFFLFKVLVSRELGNIAQGMENINQEMKKALYDEDMRHKIHHLAVRSEDKIGEVVNSFNSMSRAIDDRIQLERTIRELMVSLSSSVELEKVSETLVTALLEISGTEIGVALYASMNEKLHLLATGDHSGLKKIPNTIEPGEGLLSDIPVDGNINILDADRAGRSWFPFFAEAIDFFPALIVLMPLIAENRVVGLVVLACQQSYLTLERRKMLEMFRAYMAPYLQNALLHQRIQEMASIDGLTGCLNRRFGMRRLHEEFALAERRDKNISVLLFDVDHFKKINDSYGHAAGDYVLKNIAKLLNTSVRAGEAACRYGGEEFLIVLPDSGLEESSVLAERLRRLVEQQTYQWGQHELKITISIGVATWPNCRLESADELINEADGALYFAKKAGRNLAAVNYGYKILPLEKN